MIPVIDSKFFYIGIEFYWDNGAILRSRQRFDLRFGRIPICMYQEIVSVAYNEKIKCLITDDALKKILKAADLLNEDETIDLLLIGASPVHGEHNTYEAIKTTTY